MEAGSFLFTTLDFAIFALIVEDIRDAVAIDSALPRIEGDGAGSQTGFGCEVDAGGFRCKTLVICTGVFPALSNVMETFGCFRVERCVPEAGGIKRDPRTLFWILLASALVFWKSDFGGEGPADPTSH